MRRYETTFILTPELEETELEKNISRYSEIITSRGGTIEKEDRWGMRRLAYMIKKKTQGYYVQLVHESGPEVPRELERQFLLNESCLRYLTVLAQKPVPEFLKASPTDLDADNSTDDSDDDNDDDDDRRDRRRSANRPPYAKRDVADSENE